MSSAHTAAQLRPRFQHSTSNSLNGMETPLSNSIPLEEKPLPPTPRNPSSVYSAQNEALKNVRKQSFSDVFLQPQTSLQPTAYWESTSRALDITSKRPKLAQDVQAHAISDPIVEMRQLQQQDLDTPDTHGGPSSIRRMKPDFVAPSESINKYLTVPKNGAKGAEDYASNYESLLHTRSSALPTFTPSPYSDYDYLPSPMSPRITDVVDRSLLPSPLSYSVLEEKQRPSSTFSSSSSGSDGIQNSIRTSLRVYARKALHLPKRSLEGKNRKKASLTAASETSHISARAGRLAIRNEPVAGPRRGSIQQGISNMYDTLAKLSITSQPLKSKPAIDNTGATKARVPRALRSPAIPVTQYQQLGKKAWQSSGSSKKSQPKSSKSARTSYFSNPPGERTSYFSDPTGERTSYFSNTPCEDNSAVKFNTSVATRPGSVAKKIASAIHTGTAQVENAMGLNRVSTRVTKSERRREELKKKIVVIGLGDQNE